MPQRHQSPKFFASLSMDVLIVENEPAIARGPRTSPAQIIGQV